MALAVVTGAVCRCTFGTAPGALRVTSQSACLAAGKPVATVQDMQPYVNIPAFGMCTSLLNPAVASATAAALGVLTPQPCAFAPAGIWGPVNTRVLVCGKPCLTTQAVINCAAGMGTVKICSPGQQKMMV